MIQFTREIHTSTKKLFSSNVWKIVLADSKFFSLSIAKASLYWANAVCSCE
jgi:hypothetical protein